jgi:hypothetical protein
MNEGIGFVHWARSIVLAFLACFPCLLVFACFALMALAITFRYGRAGKSVQMGRAGAVQRRGAEFAEARREERRMNESIGFVNWARSCVLAFLARWSLRALR